MPRVLITTTGSLGDRNPMLAIGEQLVALGAEVTFATHSGYERACHESGFQFVPIGPNDYVSSLQYTRSMLEKQGFEQFVDRINFDHLDLLYAQLLAAADGADILVASAHVAPAHLVAEKMGIPYVACALSLSHIGSTAPIGSEEYIRLSASAARWHSALRKLRQDQRLERRVFPLASLLSDATKVLGVFPSFLLSALNSRTPNLEVVGYADHRQTERMVQDDELRTFCDERTVAFSFGSFAVACDPTHFFEESVAACRMLNLKCIFLTQHTTANMLEAESQDVLVRDDVAPGAVFPLVGIVVHHGGMGALVAACTHSKPMVIVPFFLDQPLHAARMQSLVGAPTIPATNYCRDTAVPALRHALNQRESMSASLRELMAEHSDGAERSAHRILSTLNG